MKTLAVWMAIIGIANIFYAVSISDATVFMLVFMLGYVFVVLFFVHIGRHCGETIDSL